MSTRLALQDARGPLSDLMGKLSSEEGGRWLRAMNRFLRKENPWENSSLQTFPVFMTVTLGEYLSWVEYKEALEGHGHAIAIWAQSFLSSIPLGRRQSLEVAIVSVGDLDLPAGSSLSRIFSRAAVRGLQICPPEVGPALRLAYWHQPLDECLHIAMDDSRGMLTIERDEHDGRLLSFLVHDHDSLWNPNTQFVFVIPKKHARNGKSRANR